MNNENDVEREGIKTFRSKDRRNKGELKRDYIINCALFFLALFSFLGSLGAVEEEFIIIPKILLGIFLVSIIFRIVNSIRKRGLPRL